jgi:hypothetical protein
MGRSFFDVPTKALPNGGVYLTTNSIQMQKTAANVLAAAAAQLETAVSAALVAAVTGTSGAGSMDRNVKSALSATYSSVTGSI